MPPDLEPSRSPTHRIKSSSVRERRPCASSSSHRSSKRDWSKSDQDDRSASTRSSRDYYRSKSHSRSGSRGSSRSRAVSKSSSCSHNRSKSRSSSRSGPRRTTSISPKKPAQLSENKSGKTEPLRSSVPPNGNVLVQPVAAENIPVIPLSDSPPPSRWKPGQKPWKPSYERIQEMKAKTTHLLPVQITYSLTNIKGTVSSSSYHKREKASESDGSAYSKYSGRSSGSSGRSRSKSSRSRSSSRSYTRSRSRSVPSSRSLSRSPSSRSHSPDKYSDGSRHSRSSSYTSVSSDDGRRATFRSSGKKSVTSNKRHRSSSEKTLRGTYAKGRETSSCHRKYSESRSSLDYSSDSEHSNVQGVHSAPEKEKQGKVEMLNGKQGKGREEGKSKPECKKRTLKGDLPDHSRGDSVSKGKNCAGSKWDSESNSEQDVTRSRKSDPRRCSDKEEGEASSDSGSEVGQSHIKAKPPAKPPTNTSLPGSDGAWKSRRPRSSASESESSCSNLGNSRVEPQKQKHSKGSLKGEREKSKAKKDKRHKAPKRKQAFHWQPPLEFGEEEEEEEVNGKQVMQDPKEKKHVSEKCEAVKDNIPKGEKTCNEGSCPNKPTKGTLEQDLLAEGERELSSCPAPLKVEENSTSSPPSTQHLEEPVPGGGEDVLQTDDNMEICTPDRTSPAKGDGVSPLANHRLDSPDVSLIPEQDEHIAHPRAGGKQESSVSESKTLGESGLKQDSSTSLISPVEITGKKEGAEKSQVNLTDKWKPLQGVGNVAVSAATTSSTLDVKALSTVPEVKPQGLRIEIKSKNKVRPGSLFDEVRKTARLNRRPRNQESSSDEQTPSRDGDSQSRSPHRSRSKSETKSRHRTRSVSYSHSRSRSRSSTSSYR